jgi:thiamine biosynthesis lipoprotein
MLTQESVADLLLPPGARPAISAPPAAGRTVLLLGETMGTEWSLAAVAPPGSTDDLLRRALEEVFARIISQMSQWDEESDLSRFNRAAPGTSHRLQKELAHVLDCALHIARASAGAFDPTIGTASDLWGFGYWSIPDRLPSKQDAAGTRRHRWTDVTLEENGRVLLQPGGLRLDLSGIAKGFAVDAGMEALSRLGVDHALLNIGGELRGSGLRADGLPWWVDIEVPPSSTAQTTRVGLTGWSIATSGSYSRRRWVESQSWSHTIDPESGLPLTDDILAVTVLHPGCMQADALATAITVLGTEKGLAFAETNAIPARMVTKSAVIESAAWTRWKG